MWMVCDSAILRFWFEFSWWLMIFSAFSCASWSFRCLVSLPFYNVFKFAHLKNWVVSITDLWLFFIYFGYKSFTRYMCHKYFLSFWIVYSFFLMWFWWANVFNFDKVHLIIFHLWLELLFFVHKILTYLKIIKTVS